MIGIIAFLQLSSLPQDDALNSRLIMTCAICGFADFASPGIMIGGLVAAVPTRCSEILEPGFKSIVSGTPATLSAGAVIGAIG